MRPASPDHPSPSSAPFVGASSLALGSSPPAGHSGAQSRGTGRRWGAATVRKSWPDKPAMVSSVAKSSSPAPLKSPSRREPLTGVAPNGVSGALLPSAAALGKPVTPPVACAAGVSNSKRPLAASPFGPGRKKLELDGPLKIETRSRFGLGFAVLLKSAPCKAAFTAEIRAAFSAAAASRAASSSGSSVFARPMPCSEGCSLGVIVGSSGRPPALAARAPWAGVNDDAAVRGGLLSAAVAGVGLRDLAVVACLSLCGGRPGGASAQAGVLLGGKADGVAAGAGDVDLAAELTVGALQVWEVDIDKVLEAIDQLKRVSFAASRTARTLSPLSASSAGAMRRCNGVGFTEGS
mmetsp:Transcript_119171/g.342440  ORF Transcript_119171/g.342440 Transcript_119171/m.342440 type:complete len:350 (+) Transcript_119171:149-1198(+)